ncbi:MAG: sigma 54-interacting transcriptional regulator, partial [Myxococcales bacterium]|nr:sigma 54-interacting transcriptional regulator [Myxococcales bacterium]
MIHTRPSRSATVVDPENNGDTMGEEGMSANQRERDTSEVRSRPHHTVTRWHEMVTVSPVMHELFELVRRVSRTTASVLIRGESGTGKELVAHAIHQLSDRAQGPMMVFDCGAVPENLIESELFGHE